MTKWWTILSHSDWPWIVMTGLILWVIFEVVFSKDDPDESEGEWY